MRTAIDAIRRLHDHRVWVRHKVLGFVRPLDGATLRRPFPMGPGSIMGVLVHCHGAEVVWLNVLEHIDPNTNIPGADAFPSLAALEEAWASTDARWERVLSGLTQEKLDEAAVRRRGDKDLTTSMGEVLIHVATHQHYHMAQLMNMLRQIGALPEPVPSIDFISMAREQWTAARS
ncbi:MAG: DinB family protein [Phycisphaeraceae bacterium]|nr:DinB family protein [Phycisphaeraceae bacterium]